MNSFLKKLYERLEDQLKDVSGEETQPLRQTARCINICRSIMQELKKYLDDNPFKEVKEEVVFFKEVYPKFYSQFIYYVKIFMIETNRPAGSDKVQIKYLRTYLDRIKYFFDNNLDFYQYYRTGATHFDEAYFVRGKLDVRLMPDDLVLAIDQQHCTIQSYKAAKLYANELLRIYINSAIAELERFEDPPSIIQSKKIQLQWTGSKVALIELIYALQSAGVFNHANADLKQVTAFFESSFQVDVGNVYSAFQEMRIRKKNRSSFLDLLRDRLIQRMDESDEEY